MRILLALILFISSTSLCFGQTVEDSGDNVSVISFDILQSRRLRYHQVDIDISLLGSAAAVKVKSKATCSDRKCLNSNIDTVYKISSDDFLKIKKAVTKISLVDIKAARLNGKDGINCSIGITQDGKLFSLTAWSPAYKTEERKLGAYLDACKLILKAAKLKKKKVL